MWSGQNPNDAMATRGRGRLVGCGGAPSRIVGVRAISMRVGVCVLVAGQRGVSEVHTACSAGARDVVARLV